MTMALRDGFALGPFTVRWRERVVAVRVEASGAGEAGILGMRTVLGWVPSTAERRGITARQRVFAVIRELPLALPGGWHAALLSDHRIGLAAAARLEGPATAGRLVAEVSAFLLTLTPYLDALEEAGLAGTGLAGAGTVNSWPG